MYGLGRPGLFNDDGLALFVFIIGCGWSLAIAVTLAFSQAAVEDARWSRFLLANIVLLDLMQAGLLSIIAPYALLRSACAFAVHAAVLAALTGAPGRLISWFRPSVRLLATATIFGALVTILFGIAYQSWRVLRKRSALFDAIHTVGDIRVAQEVYRSEAGHYANVSRALAANQGTNHSALYPQAPFEPARRAFPWGIQCPESACRMNWQVLPVFPDRAVYGYTTVAGPPSAGPPAKLVIDANDLLWSPPPAEWFIVTAVGDPTGEGLYTTVIASSLWPELLVDNP